MFVPSFNSILRAIGSDLSTLNDSSEVTIPLELLKFLLQTALIASEFNEAGYLAANPDVGVAVQTKAVASARLHYISFGYLEGRTGAMPQVDERWYLATYPDVAEAVRTGQISSATEHFEVIGASEGRSPNARHEEAASRWKKALVKNPEQDRQGTS
jgi:hypothetical protein